MRCCCSIVDGIIVIYLFCGQTPVSGTDTAVPCVAVITFCLAVCDGVQLEGDVIRVPVAVFGGGSIKRN